jgi:hypothetical protein
LAELFSDAKAVVSPFESVTQVILVIAIAGVVKLRHRPSAMTGDIGTLL